MGMLPEKARELPPARTPPPSVLEPRSPAVRTPPDAAVTSLNQSVTTTDQGSLLGSVTTVLSYKTNPNPSSPMITTQTTQSEGSVQSGSSEETQQTKGSGNGNPPYVVRSTNFSALDMSDPEVVQKETEKLLDLKAQLDAMSDLKAKIDAMSDIMNNTDGSNATPCSGNTTAQPFTSSASPIRTTRDPTR